MNSANNFCTCLLKTWLPVVLIKEVWPARWNEF